MTRTHKTSNPELDALWQQKSTSVFTPVIQESGIWLTWHKLTQTGQLKTGKLGGFFSTLQLSSLGVFFTPFWINSRDCCVWKIPRRSVFDLYLQGFLHYAAATWLAEYAGVHLYTVYKISKAVSQVNHETQTKNKQWLMTHNPDTEQSLTTEYCGGGGVIKCWLWAEKRQVEPARDGFHLYLIRG